MDKHADVRIFAKVDGVMAELARGLRMPVPPYRRTDSVILGLCQERPSRGTKRPADSPAGPAGTDGIDEARGMDLGPEASANVGTSAHANGYGGGVSTRRAAGRGAAAGPSGADGSADGVSGSRARGRGGRGDPGGSVGKARGGAGEDREGDVGGAHGERVRYSVVVESVHGPDCKLVMVESVDLTVQVKGPPSQSPLCSRNIQVVLPSSHYPLRMTDMWGLLLVAALLENVQVAFSQQSSLCW